jgi:hypothetical protein
MIMFWSYMFKQRKYTKITFTYFIFKIATGKIIITYITYVSIGISMAVSIRHLALKMQGKSPMLRSADFQWNIIANLHWPRRKEEICEIYFEMVLLPTSSSHSPSCVHHWFNQIENQQMKEPANEVHRSGNT